MPGHYFHHLWRQWRARPSHAIINLGGLAAGLTVALLIGLWIADEVSFDHSFPNHNRIVKLVATKSTDVGPVTTDLLSPPLVDEIKANHGRFFRHLAIVFPNFPHVLSPIVVPRSLSSRPTSTDSAHYWPTLSEGPPTTSDIKITAEGQWAQPEWPEILQLRMVRGTRKALEDPSSVLIDQSTAAALFGSNDPDNAMIRVDNSIIVKVAGVYADIPSNSSFAGTHLLLAWSKAADEMPWFKDVQKNWDAAGFWIFGELADAKDQSAACNDIRKILQDRITGNKDELGLYPMDRWHLYSEFQEGKSTTGRIRIVYLFAFTGVVVLLLACINFMNLATARSERRAREVGIRKTLGSSRWQLVIQFLSESVMLAGCALILAIGLSQLLLPLFNLIAVKNLRLPYDSLFFWLLTLSFTLFTGLISGSYPAIFLSHFRPAEILTSRYSSPGHAGLIRKSLVVLQFTVSIALIIATAVIYRQVEFAMARPPGYVRDGLIALRMSTTSIYNAPYNSLRYDLLQSGAALEMAQSSNAATERPPDLGDISWEGKDPSSRPPFTLIEVSHDFGKTIQWKMAEGRDFSRDFATDSNVVLINESAAKLIGWKDPIGQTIRFWGTDRRIIGVVNDIVSGSPYQPPVPTIFPLSYRDVNYITIRLNPARPTGAALNTIAAIIKKYDPSSPFNPHFVADDYALKFSAEQQVERIAAGFAVLAVFISCLGLFGLASYIAEQRTKEIGIRKILGADVTQLITLLSSDFLRLILVAIAIAFPLSVWATHQWLRSYPYRTSLSAWIFIAAGLGAIAIALLTVSAQAIRTALANPVNSLRSE